MLEFLLERIKTWRIERSRMKKMLMTATVPSMIGQFNMENIRILQEMGFCVHVACDFNDRSVWTDERVRRFIEELSELKVSHHQIDFSRNPLNIKKNIKAYNQLKQLIKEEKIEMLHCHTPVAGVISRLVAHRYRIRVIYTAHGFHFYNGAPKKNWLAYYPIEKFLSRWTDILITINQEDYKRAQEFHAKKVEYVPGIGVHTKEFKNVMINRKAKRAEFGFKDIDFVFMSTGQISVRKNHEVIIKALAELNNTNVKYLIAGFGEEENRLKKLALELGVTNQVVFAGYRNDVKELLHAVDGFAFPSLQEGLPVALMEAMAVGLPIVCSRIRGNEDLICNGVGGFLVDPYNIEGFKKGMELIVNGVSEEMGATNIEMMKNFDIDTVNKKMRQIYRNI